MFDQGKQNISPASELVGGICRLASCMEGHTSAQEREAALQEALRLAHHIEETLHSRNERIAYLDRLAMTDGLTGILNRRGFQTELQRVLASARRYLETGLLAYIDLDDFKVINDNFGHACGDEVLTHIARLLEGMTRGTDYVARLGGDEFCVLLVRSDWEDGQKCIEKIAHTINTTTLRWQNETIRLQASIGLQRYDHRSSNYDLLHEADEAMYATKKIRQDIQSEKCALSAAE